MSNLKYSATIPVILGHAGCDVAAVNGCVFVAMACAIERRPQVHNVYIVAVTLIVLACNQLKQMCNDDSVSELGV